MLSLEDTIDQITRHHRQARFAMKQQLKMDRSLEAFFRVNVSGFSTGDDEASRAKASKAAIAAIKTARADPADPYHRLVVDLAEARKPFDAIRNANERAMSKLAVGLPGYELVKSTRGFGEKGFAQIVAEAGDLSNYPTHSHLWKRLGLAVMSGGRRQGNPGKNASADDWITHGYSGERRSILWNIAGSLFKAQSGAEPGPYRLIYDARKEYEAARNERDGLGLTKAHIHNRAMRYMEKRLVRDLWGAWRRDVNFEPSPAAQKGAEIIMALGRKVREASCTDPASAGGEAMERLPSGQSRLASPNHPASAGERPFFACLRA